MKPLFRFKYVYIIGALCIGGGASKVSAAEVDPTKPALTALIVDERQQLVSGNPVLQSIFKRAKEKTAIISGKSYRQGDAMGEFTVLKINVRDVVISDGREQRTLKLYTHEIKK